MAARIDFKTDERNGALSVRVEGTFDGQAALRLQQLLEELKANEVELDFSQTRQFLDLAVALLTRSLGQRQVRFRGLGAHQERMFRYFGVATSAKSEPAVYYKPEDVLAH